MQPVLDLGLQHLVFQILVKPTHIVSSDQRTVHADSLHLLRQILAIRIAAAQRLPVGGVRSEQREILSAGISIHGDIPAELPLGFAEGHPDARNRIREMDYLKAKIDEGADYICTQLFFDNHAFFDFRDRCRILGIDVPIIAGIMPVTSVSSMNRMADLSPGTNFPARLLKALLRAGGDKASLERVGINYASNQCSELLDDDVDGIHFYTLNRSKATLQIYRNLGINSCYDVDRIHMLNEIYNS